MRLDNRQHVGRQVAGKGFNHQIGRGRVAQIGRLRRLPCAKRDALMGAGQGGGRIGGNSVQRGKVVQPQMHLPAEPLAQLLRQPPRHADVAKVVNHGAKKPTGERFGGRMARFVFVHSLL